MDYRDIAGVHPAVPYRGRRGVEVFEIAIHNDISARTLSA
jgi:hypothetical protein